jgi:hypothetical protein
VRVCGDGGRTAIRSSRRSPRTRAEGPTVHKLQLECVLTSLFKSGFLVILSCMEHVEQIGEPLSISHSPCHRMILASMCYNVSLRLIILCFAHPCAQFYSATELQLAQISEHRPPQVRLPGCLGAAAVHFLTTHERTALMCACRLKPCWRLASAKYRQQQRPATTACVKQHVGTPLGGSTHVFSWQACGSMRPCQA